jgi:hypothetical protein
MSMRVDSATKRLCLPGLGLTALVSCGAVLADDVTGSDALLCYALNAMRCELDGSCDAKEPWQLNLPDFLKLDLRAKQALTTEASGHARETAIRTVERRNGTIMLQGEQNERAFSWVITESTGEGTLTVSSPAAGLTVFTVCTPIDKL